MEDNKANGKDHNHIVIKLTPVLRTGASAWRTSGIINSINMKKIPPEI